MSIKNKEFNVDTDDIFAGDKLGRKAEVINIGKLLVSLPSPLTLSVNSPWGTGKTAFSKLLQAHLNFQGFHAFYFSAWETDFASDPLTAFLGEMNDQMSSFISEDEEKSRAWVKVKKAGSYLAQRVVPAVVKAGTATIIDIEEIKNVLSDTAEAVTNDALTAYLSEKAVIATFRENVSKIVGLEPENSVYVFIDELDRCRPSYAIELLERIKHLLNIEGLTFVLSMDRVQLSHSIQALYGLNFDASGYLKRFIDIEYNLKAVQFPLYISHLFGVLGLEPLFITRKARSSSFEYERKNILESLSFFAKSGRVSLRDLEQLVAKVKLVYFSTQLNEEVFPHLTAFMIYLQHQKPSCLVLQNSPQQVRRLLISELAEIAVATHDRYHRVAAVIEAQISMLRFPGEREPDEDPLRDHIRIAESSERDVDERAYSAKIIRIRDGIINDIYSNISFEELYSRVAMLSDFDF